MKQSDLKETCVEQEGRLLAKMKAMNILYVTARPDSHYQVERAVDSDGPLLQGGPTIRRSFPPLIETFDERSQVGNPLGKRHDNDRGIR